MSRKGGLSGPLLECHKQVKKLMAHKLAWPFNVPVDPIALNIPTYFDIIKHPMDLSTVLSKLENGEYSSPEEVNDDVNLVWNNARTFNPPTHDVAKMAEILAKQWERVVPRILGSDKGKKGGSKAGKFPITEHVLPAPSGPRSESTAEMANTIFELKESMQHVRAEIARFRQTSSPPPVSTSSPLPSSPSPSTKKRTSSGSLKSKVKEMTYEEKALLSDNIKNLDSLQLENLLKIIKKAFPSLQGSTDNTIEIELDKMDNKTLREIDSYIKACMKKKKPTPVKPSQPAFVEHPPVVKENSSASEGESDGGPPPAKKVKAETEGQDELHLRVTQLEQTIAELKQERDQLRKELEEERQQKVIFKKKIELMEKALKD